MSQSFSNNSNSWNTTVNVLNTAITNVLALDDDRHNILCWLSPLDPRLRHQDIQARRVENVGEWLLQTQEFRSWGAGSREDEPDHAVLFCYGDPGVGKTYISSLVIDRLCDQAGGQNATVACFYFDFAARKEQYPTSMLGALLRQLVCGLEETPEEITRAYQGQRHAIGGRGPQLSDIVKMIRTTSSKKRTFICIDALDECAVGHRVKLLDSLNQVLENSPGTRIFVTGRPHIRPEIGRRLPGRVASVSISPKRDDIIEYLRTRLDEDAIPDAMDSSLEADILKKIPEDISQIFLLVSLNIDAILRETTIHRRRQKLNAMTGGLGLGGAYGAMLDRIKGQDEEKSRLGMAVLMWISHSERPLKADEICHALAVEIGSPHLNGDNIPSIGTLLACCQGLVALDKEASTVRLIHYTLQEYLRAHPGLSRAAHSTMAETCLSYLNSQQVRALSAIPSSYCRRTPFLEYSSLYWGVHAERDLSDCAKLLALKLFDDYSNCIPTRILLERYSSYFCETDPNRLSLFSGLHCASLFGIVEIAAALIEVEGCDINGADCVGNTPLVWAAENGHEGVVKILLGRGDVDPNELGSYGQTPLCCAARGGHEEVVKTLLERGDVNPNRSRNYGPTPLFCAAENGHEGIVETLLERSDIDPTKPGGYDQTPLHCAAQNGHDGVVKTLLGREDVDPNGPSTYGQTPLWFAARNGHEGVVRTLLERDDVDPSKTGVYGRTPLCAAADNGQEGVVKILLGRDEVNPDAPDDYGQTPLYRAARGRHEGVMKTLLERDDIDPNSSGDCGQTPLSLAVLNGYEGVVKKILERGDADLSKLGKNGRTLLWVAALCGHGKVVKALLERGEVDPDDSGNYGQTPLWCAAEHGNEEVVKILLGRGDVNPNKSDNEGQTPLCCAARNGHKGVVEMLLERDDVNSDKPDYYGRTPLWRAAENGHEGVVRILLGREEVGPDKPDDEGQTPLVCAARNGHKGVVEMLRTELRQSRQTV